MQLLALLRGHLEAVLVASSYVFILALISSFVLLALRVWVTRGRKP